MTAPQLFAAGALAYGATKLFTAQTPQQQWVSGQQANINQSDFTQGMHNLTQGIFEAAAGTAGQQQLQARPGFMQGLSQQMHGNVLIGAKDEWTAIAQGLFGSGGVQTAAGTNTAAVAQWNQQMKEVQGTAQDIAKQFGVSLPQAFALADQAGLQVGDNLDKKTGQLNTKSATMIQNTLQGYQAMNQTVGAMGESIAANQVSKGLAGSQLSTTISSWDQIIGNAAGGTSAATGFAGSLAGAATLGSPAKIAQALKGFTSPASQAAWAAFSSTSTSTPGLLQQVNSLQDWLATAQTAGGGAFTQKESTAAGLFEAKSLLPMAQQSPAALAELGVTAQRAGYTGPLGNYKDIAQYIDKNAASAKQFNQIMTHGTEVLSNVSQQAQGFGDSMKTNVYDAMEAGSVNTKKVTADMQQLSSGISGGKLTPSGASALKGVAQDLASVKASAGDVNTILGTVLSGKGMNAAGIKSAIAQVNADMNSIHPKDVKVAAQADTSQVDKLKASIAALQSKTVRAAAQAEGAAAVAALNAEIAALHDKLITITVRQIGVGVSAPGFSPTLTTPGALGIGHAAGYLVPGTGSGDHMPALLEPGEAVVPKFLVPLIAPILKSHHVPGFQSGGIVPAGTLSGISAQISSEYNFLDQLYSNHATQAQINNFWKTVLDPLYAAKNKLTGATTAIAKAATSSGSSSGNAIITGPGGFSFSGSNSLATEFAAGLKQWTTDIAKQTTNQIVTSIDYARNVATAAAAGQGYGTTGLMNTLTAPPAGSASGAGLAPPGTRGYNAGAWNAYVANFAAEGAAGISGQATTPTPSIAQQLQTYLGTEQSFSKDLGSLSKGGLNRSILSQLIAAGPTTGDADAQSILSGGAGGIAAVNKLWQQISTASQKLGGTAAGALYGGHPSTSGGQYSAGSVTVNVNVGGAGSSVNLTTAQISQITAQVQAALLKQAKRNRKTNLTLPGKGA